MENAENWKIGMLECWNTGMLSKRGCLTFWAVSAKREFERSSHLNSRARLFEVKALSNQTPISSDLIFYHEKSPNRVGSCCKMGRLYASC